MGKELKMQQDGLWQAVLGEIELSVSRGNFVTWFKNTSLLRNDDDAVIVGVPNVFIKQQLERKYADLIRSVLQKNGTSPKELLFKIQHQPIKRESAEALLGLVPTAAIPSAPTAAPNQTQTSFSHKYRQGINERYTF